MNILQSILLILSLLTISQAVNLGTTNLYERQESCGWFSCSKEAPGYCDSFTSLETSHFAGTNKQYLIVSCTYNKGVYIFDLDNMNIVKQWTNRSTAGIPSGGVQHSSSIKIYESLLITMEDWDGLEALDYKSSSSGAALSKTMCNKSPCNNDRTVHRQMIQVIDPVTQQGGKFLYAYRYGGIRFTKINGSAGNYSWSEVRNPIDLNVSSYGITGVSQLDGTTLVIFSTTSGFQIYDAGQDHLPKIQTTTNASSSELDCQYAAHIKGTRTIVSYDYGVLKVFEISPPDIFPIKIDYVKKHSTNKNGSIQEIKSLGGRQVGLITKSYAEIWDIGVVDNDNVNTSYQMSKIKSYNVDNQNNNDFSAAIFRVPNTNYIVYNNNNYDIIIDYACHYSCGDCNANGVYGECTSCANSSNYSTAPDGLKMEKNRTLQNGQCSCVDNNDPCTYVDVGGRFCYHETAFSDSPTKCCGTNSCINDINSDICIERSNQCPELKQLAIFFDPLSGYWYPTPANPEYNCHYTCYVCLSPAADMCRSCDEENTNRVLVGSPGECVCKQGYVEQNAGDKNCVFDAPCVDKCLSCSFGQCSQCTGSQNYKNNECECMEGYKDDGNDNCIKDCKDDETNRQLSGGSCVCQTGYQETSPAGDNCEEIPCVNKCVSCSLGVCSQCQGSQLHKDPQSCECVSGYKFEGLNCIKDCQDDLTNRELVNGNCVCQTGYYEVNSGDASCTELPCVDKCQTCSLGNCQACYGGQENKDPQTCECNTGYLEKGNICEFDCQTETTNKVWDTNDEECVCDTGYELTNPWDINCSEIPCVDKCKVCSLGVCQQCKGTTYQRDDQTCECAAGYEDFNNVCRKDCQNSTTNRVNDEDDSEQCVCDDGYQETNPVSANCEEIPCVPKCQTCSLGVCQLCFSPAHRDDQTCECLIGYKEDGNGNCEIDCYTATTNKELVNGVCTCQQGYHEANAGDAICSEIPCVDKCTSCSLGVCSACNGGEDNKSLSDCECDSGFFELDTGVCEVDCDTDNTHKKWDYGTSQCDCIQGYNDDAVAGTCEEDECGPKCQTCSTGNCSACFGTADNRNPPGSDQNVSCQCLAGYEDFEGKCRKFCDYDNTFRVNVDGDLEACVCDAGYQEKTPQAADCEEIPCNNKCDQCSKGVCQLCIKPANRDTTTCDCITGYIENAQGYCELNCYTATTFKELDANGNCVCLSGYYLANTNDANCTELPCVDKCATCSLGVCSQCEGQQEHKDDQTCECIDGYLVKNDGCEFDCRTADTNKFWDTVSESCICQDGYELLNVNDDACTEKTCVEKCKTCSLGVCLECKGTDYQRDDQTCECAVGYEDFNNVCRKACDGDNTNRYNDFNNSELCVCKQGYQETNPVSANCEEIPCVPECETCSLGVCSKCYGEPENRDSQTCQCFDGYIENADDECEIDCETATTNRILSDQNICECKVGFEEATPGAANCTPIPCSDKCATCVLGVCQACQDNQDNKDDQSCECLPGYHLVGDKCLWNCQTDLTYKELVDENGTDCQCVQGYFTLSSDQFVCQEIPCSSKCQTCVLGECQQCQGDQNNKDDQSCECVDGFTEITGKCYLECNTETTNRAINFLTETCECKKGYYEENVGDAVCVEIPCTDKCISCSKGICLECEGEPLYRDPQSCECEEKTVEVVKEVDGVTIKECIPIKKGLNREPEQPFDCLQGFYEQANSHDCLPCSPLCESCITKNECTECTFFFFNKPPTCRVFSMFNEVTAEEENLQEELASCEVQPGCDSCDEDSGKCISCDETLNRELNKFNSLCECKAGFKEYRNREACQKCYYYAGECLITCPKNTNLDQETQHCKDIEYESQDNVLYLIILVAGVITALGLTTFGVIKMPLKVRVQEVHMELNNKEQDLDQSQEESGSDIQSEE